MRRPRPSGRVATDTEAGDVAPPRTSESRLSDAPVDGPEEPAASATPRGRAAPPGGLDGEHGSRSDDPAAWTRATPGTGNRTPSGHLGGATRYAILGCLVRL